MKRELSCKCLSINQFIIIRRPIINSLPHKCWDNSIKSSSHIHNITRSWVSTHHLTLSIPPLLKQSQFLGRSLNVSSSFRSLCSSARSKPVVSVLEIGRVTIDNDDVVKDDPTNNVPDTIYSKLGLQLHKRDKHQLGILKNAIQIYFNSNYSGKFVNFDDLCPIVSARENFDDVLVPADHVNMSYNDTYYIDAQTVLRCHTSAHQAEPGLILTSFTEPSFEL